MKQISILAVLSIAVGLGIAAAVMRPSFKHPTAVAAESSARAGLGEQAGVADTAASCVGAVAGGSSRSALTQRYGSARALLARREFALALGPLREVAAADPGYPGVNLDLSNALLQMGRPAAAKVAADAQMSISECLTRLPRKALDMYCSAELPHTDGDRCLTQQAYFWHAAQLQRTLVDLEMTHSAEPHVTDVAQFERQPKAAESAPGQRPKADPGSHAEARKSTGDRSLMDGAGTDSDLGAYSKQ